METKEKRRSTGGRRTGERTRPADRTRSAERPKTADRTRTAERPKTADRTGAADRAKAPKRTASADRSRSDRRTEGKAAVRTAPKPEQRPERRRAERPGNKSSERRRKNPAKAVPDREERRRRVQRSRQAKAGRPQQEQRVVRPPREDIPRIVYTPPKPMRRGRFLWKLVSMAAVVAAVFLGLSVFFRVETITVAGADKYTPWMIRQAAGVQTGDALLSISEARVASRIITELPYIDEVKVGVRLPGTVELQVKELQVAYAVRDEAGGWWLISSSGRAVEQTTAEQAGSYTAAAGVTIRTPKKGEQVRAHAAQAADPADPTAVSGDQSGPDERLEALIAVMTALEENRIIGQVSRIDVSDPGSILLEYPQLLTVRLGDTAKLSYKISILAGAMEQLSRHQSGTLDLTMEYSDTGIFSPAR